MRKPIYQQLAEANRANAKIKRLIKAAEAACFVVETVAHLKGRESDELRAAIAAVSFAPQPVVPTRDGSGPVETDVRITRQGTGRRS